jgi:hypothetical protein
LQVKVAKKESLELDQEIAYIRLAKKELQEHDHQQSNPSIVKEERDSRVDVPHLKRDAINELYIKKFKKFFYYCWI